jgi:hypothetical protein
MQEGSKISMQFSRQPTLGQEAFPQLRKPSGSNSNRDSKLLKTGVNYTKQRTPYHSNRDRIRVLLPPHTGLFFRSLLAKRLAVPSGSISNRQSPKLEIHPTDSKHGTSLFLIANFGALLAPPCAARQQFS